MKINDWNLNEICYCFFGYGSPKGGKSDYWSNKSPPDVYRRESCDCATMTQHPDLHINIAVIKLKVCYFLILIID